MFRALQAKSAVDRHVEYRLSMVAARIAPLAIMVAAAASVSWAGFSLAGRLCPRLEQPRRIVERRAFEEAGGIVGVRPCGRGEDKGEGSAGKHDRRMPRKLLQCNDGCTTKKRAASPTFTGKLTINGT